MDSEVWFRGDMAGANHKSIMAAWGRTLSPHYRLVLCSFEFNKHAMLKIVLATSLTEVSPVSWPACELKCFRKFLEMTRQLVGNIIVSVSRSLLSVALWHIKHIVGLLG